MKIVFQKLNFGILSMHARVRVYKLLVNYFSADFSEIKFQKVNEISEISKITYLQKFPAIQYVLNLRNLNEVNVGEQVSKMVVVRSRAPTGRICIRYIIYQCALLRMQYVYCTTCAKTWKTSIKQ